MKSHVNNLFIISLLIFSSSFVANSSFAVDNADKHVMTIPGKEKIININKADIKTLALLKGIGKKKASAIVDYRQSVGKFNSIDELTNVKGVTKRIIMMNKKIIKV